MNRRCITCFVHFRVAELPLMDPCVAYAIRHVQLWSELSATVHATSLVRPLHHPVRELIGSRSVQGCRRGVTPLDPAPCHPCRHRRQEHRISPFTGCSTAIHTSFHLPAWTHGGSGRPSLPSIRPPSVMQHMPWQHLPTCPCTRAAHQAHTHTETRHGRGA